MTAIYLPAARHLIALRLRSKGLSQHKISALLGVTQASVSYYLSTDSERAYGLLSRLSIARDQADRDIALLTEDLSSGAVHAVATLSRLWTTLLGGGYACAAHREMYPSLADCDFCVKEYGAKSSLAGVISEVAEASRILEDSREFVQVMPEVSVNIACAAKGATTPGEVVAIPGRLVRVRGRARAMLPPEAGASAHMSRVLLLAMKRRPRIRACINIRYDRRMANVVREGGLRTTVIGNYPMKGDDPTAEALEMKLRSVSGTLDAIIDEGGAGIEPNLYLFDKGAREVVEVALKLARAYSAR